MTAGPRARTAGRRFAATLATGTLGVLVALPADLSRDGRFALFAFGAAAIAWVLTALEPAYVALLAVAFMVLTRTVDSSVLFDALGAQIIWLMIGAFILGAAIQASGLAARLTSALVGRSTTVGSSLWRVTWALVPLAFVLPSTSGRAAVALPLYDTLASAAADRAVARALGLLFPSIIIISTAASLVGAGSHLVADTLLEQAAHQRIGFAAWLAWGLPFGLAASIVTTFVIGRMFLDADQRQRVLALPERDRKPFTSAEWRTAAITLVMLALWLTEHWQPLGVALVAVLGALALTAPGIGVIAWKTGVDAVSWNLIVFVGAALVLGKALIDTGAAKWLVHSLFAAFNTHYAGAPFLFLTMLCAIGVTSHLYITSHTARAAALLPPLFVLAQRAGLDDVATMFVATVAMDYCLTLPVSSKALLLFYEREDAPWTAADLFKLSCVLMPLYALLVVGFYLGYWRYTGLSL